MDENKVYTLGPGGFMKKPPEKNCPTCKGTGKVKKICFGEPGYIMEDCSCTRKWDKNAPSTQVRY